MIQSVDNFTNPALVEDFVNSNPLGLSAISTLNCQTVDKEISNAQALSMTWKPTPEGEKAYTDWMDAAVKIAKKCKEPAVLPIIKSNKLSKNLTPIVILLGVAVAAVILTKFIKNKSE